jgi:hypothetical protein
MAASAALPRFPAENPARFIDHLTLLAGQGGQGMKYPLGTITRLGSAGAGGLVQGGVTGGPISAAQGAVRNLLVGWQGPQVALAVLRQPGAAGGATAGDRQVLSERTAGGGWKVISLCVATA